MKQILLSLLVVIAVAHFATVVKCEGNAKGQQRIDADAAAERFDSLLGKTLKPGFEGLVKASVKPHRSYGAIPLGIIRRVPQQYPTIQAGIVASVNGDTVLVSEGTYFENIDYSGKRVIVASLYLLDQDTSHVSRTIIDGNQAGSVVSFISGEDTNSVLCGFTVRGGSGTYIPAWDEADGGGVFLWQSGGRLVRNIITGNSVEAPYAWGGGVSITGLTNVGQTLIMEQNIVSRNTVNGIGQGYGGGVAVYQSQFRLTGNVFEHDSSRGLSAAGGGGVIIYATTGNQQVDVIGGNVFSGNVVVGDSISRSSGLFLAATGATVIEDNSFEDNSVTSLYTAAFGGAIYVVDVSAISPEKRITRNVIRRNRLTNNLRYTYGGAMMVQDAHVRFTENVIQDNISQAGINAVGGGIYGNRWAGTIENNIFTGNTGTHGGGIFLNGAPPSGLTQVIVNNTFSRNQAEFGGGFYDGGFGTIAVLLNNIFWDDSSSNGEIYAAGSIEVHYSNIEGGWVGGTGNINANPMFADTLYRLADSSPCIGTGRDSMQIAGTWYRSPARDFGGNSRPMPAGSQPDMGALENSLGTPTDVADGRSGVPALFELAQNYPNPFNPVTKIGYRIQERGFVSLKVFDVLGREVATLVGEEKPSGTYSVSWDATGRASGVYLYRLESRGFSQTRKLILLR